MMTTTTPTLAIEEVTPEKAAEWLANMAPNRKASDRRVMFLADQMRDGLWVFDGAPIRFDVDGRLSDGQNRLQALIRAEVTLPFVIVRDLPKEAMSVMDTGKSRTLPDILQMAHPDLTQTISIAATTRTIFLWEELGIRGTRLRSTAGRASIPNSVLLDYYQQHEETIRDVVRRGRAITQHQPGLTGSALSLCLYLFDQIDAEDSEFFFARLVDGAGLEAGSPILALRRRAIEAARQDRRAALPTEEAVALIIKAWNAFRAGESLQVLAWKRGGASPESFPEPR